MAHERVGDRTDHPHRAGAKPVVEHVLQKDDMRAAVGKRLVVHPVVGGDPDDAAKFDEARDAPVELLVKRQRLRLVGGVAVLHVVGQRQIEEFGAAVLDQPDPGIEHEERQIGGVHVGLFPSDQRLDLAYPVLVDGAAVGEFRRKADALHVVAQHPAQLVLGGDRCNRHAGLRHRREQRRRAQHRRVGHHHLGAGLPVEREIAGDAVLGRRDASDDRDVVGIGKGRHRRLGNAEKAGFAGGGDGRQYPRLEARFEISRIAAIGTDHCDRPAWAAVGAAVESDLFHSKRLRGRIGARSIKDKRRR